LSPIVVTPWAKHEGIGFDGRSENSITTKKIIFVKAIDTLDLAFSSREGEAIVNEGGIPLPPQPSFDRLKEIIDEKSLQTRPIPTHRERNEPINER
jgi:hypothetical protein